MPNIAVILFVQPIRKWTETHSSGVAFVDPVYQTFVAAEVWMLLNHAVVCLSLPFFYEPYPLFLTPVCVSVEDNHRLSRKILGGGSG
jgi:hypothetical protein